MLLSFAAGHRKSYWSGCIKAAVVICEQIFSIVSLWTAQSTAWLRASLRTALTPTLNFSCRPHGKLLRCLVGMGKRLNGTWKRKVRWELRSFDMRWTSTKYHKRAGWFRADVLRKDEKSSDDMRREENSCDQLRRAEEGRENMRWDEVKKAEKTWDELRWYGMT